MHALELAWRLLSPDGLLIDIHPTGDPPPVNAIILGKQLPLGKIDETDNFVEYPQASAALQNVIQRGIFELEGQNYFEFRTVSASLAEMRDYLSQTWSDAILVPEIEKNAALLLQPQLNRNEAYHFEIVERVCLSRLRRTS